MEKEFSVFRYVVVVKCSRIYSPYILRDLIRTIYCNYNRLNLIDLIDLFVIRFDDNQITLIGYHTYLPKSSYKYEYLVLGKYQAIRA